MANWTIHSEYVWRAKAQSTIANKVKTSGRPASRIVNVSTHTGRRPCRLCIGAAQLVVHPVSSSVCRRLSASQVPLASCESGISDEEEEAEEERDEQRTQYNVVGRGKLRPTIPPVSAYPTVRRAV